MYQLADNTGGPNNVFDGSVVALLRDLTASLYITARSAELADPAGFADIQKRVEQDLRLIDSFMFAAQAEHGQLRLELVPVALGSIMHEVVYSAHDRSSLIQARAHAPVMTHPAALKSLLQQLLALMQSMGSSDIVLRSFVTRSKHVGVGVFAKHVGLSAEDLRVARTQASSMHMAMPKQSHRSGVQLTIADGLARLLDTSLQVKHMGVWSGLVVELPRSEQLALI